MVLVRQAVFKIGDEKLKEYLHYYNNERISLKLNRMSPVQYQAHSQNI